jgi:hypothetical protein
MWSLLFPHAKYYFPIVNLIMQLDYSSLDSAPNTPLENGSTPNQGSLKIERSCCLEGESVTEFPVGKSQRVLKCMILGVQAQNFLKATAVSVDLSRHVATVVG